MESGEMMVSNVFEDKKRKMKTPLQLETLERVYAEEKYPSQAVRGQLSIQLGLSNRQVKMWFCHRRQKERKSKGDDEELGSSDKSLEHRKEAPVHPYQAFSLFPSLVGKSTFPVKEEDQFSGGSCNSDNDHAWKSRRRPQGFADLDRDSPKRKRSRPAISNGADSWRVAELQAIASVEAQLGEPLRWDSPCLGIEFDPLPPGAFGSTAVPSQYGKPSPTQEARNHLDSKNESKVDLGLHRDVFLVEKSRSRKVAGTDNGPSSNGWSSSRSLQEYQFIPERPTGREEMASSYEISGQVKTFPQINRQELVLQDPFLPESESLKSASRFEGKPFSASGGLFIQRDIYHTNVFPQSQLTHQDLLPNLGFDGHPGGVKNLHHALPASCVFPDLEKMPLYNEHEVILESKKRKIEEIKIAKEVEAYRKRLQREAEREELARRKRIEQLQREQEKEAEKLVREKQREDERLMRDKQREDERLQRDRQREEERLQREARRESERLERLAQKEAQRLEREREKEEARRQKEATRLKAAIERATARRLARECVELIDDERLELLEVAATSQGLPSIYLLDGETLQGLDRFKDCLKKFPPPAVKMKIPLGFSPWADSHQNVGNLFMIWRFLVAFTDVLGLWPFTLDELVQAFHDYESRLLAEIHMALFRTIVKDVEDVAKAAASSGAVNQYTAPSTIGGGHTQLVEAAFARGYDYRDWSRLLSPSTWPDILRQFGIAAGFGSPLWKHPTVEGREVICKGNVTAQTGNVSRSGGTGSNSSVFLKSKMCFTRKVGHRLTPGTVKFSAFHVLSVAGARGLSIAEVASRIEKYGLRNLTASKTPESTIAAALSRDTVFFERVAPSTYCVKAAYRKNPEDAERLIQEALEKTRLFHSGVLDAYDLEKGVEGSDEVERELNSGDELEDMEADDVHQKGSSVAKHRDFDTYDKNVRSTDSTSKHQSVGRVNGWTQSAREGEAHIGRGVASLLDNKADETDGAEPWVKGLIKGEYTGLSVDERLDALVALVEAVNEGNTIRVALEERLEAATALKRQMWAEAQLDKRRTKEEQLLKAQSQGDGGGGSEGMKGEGGAAPLMDDTQTAGNVSPAMDKDGGPPMAGISSSEKSRAQLKAEIDFRADELYVFRSTALGLDRRRNRYWQFATSYTAEDPGCGRIFFESSEDGHWEVIDNEEAFNALMASLDMRGIREAQLLGVLQKLEGLIRQGMRRLASFKKPEQNLLIPQSQGNSGDFPKSRSPSQNVVPLEGMSSGEGSAVQVKEVRMRKGAIQVELGINQSGKECVLRQYRDFDRWLWSGEAPGSTVLSTRRPKKKRGPELLAKCETCHSLFWDEEKQCSCCCRTSAESGAKYSRHLREGETKTSGKNAIKKLRYPTSALPSRVQLLKAQMLSVEAAVPAEALKTGWTEKARKTWASSIKHASSASELLQLLSELESVVSRDWLPRSFECSKDVLESGRAKATGHSTALLWIPRTTAAVAMRLAEFDAAVLYGSEQKLQSSHSRRKAYGASKKSQSTDTVAPSFAEEGDHLLKDSGKQGSPNERKHAKRKVVMKGMLNISKDLRGCDGGADASIMEKAVIKDRRGGKGKQFLPLDDESDEHAQVSKIQRVDDRHELHISGKGGFQDLDHQSSPKFHYQEEDVFSVEEEEVEEEVIIDEEEEEGGECAMQDRRWANANEKCEADLTAEEAENGEDEGVDEGGETYSTEEEGHSGEDDGCGDDEAEQDQYNQCKSEQECHVVGSSGEEDSEDDESSDGSTDSESSDESD